MKFFRGFGYAFKGLWVATSEQLNMKVHLLAAVAVVAVGFYFKVTLTEWCILTLCIGAVIALEIINTALEYLVDLVSPQQHPLAGKIKDVSAGAVLVMAITAAVIAVLIFGNYIV